LRGLTSLSEISPLKADLPLEFLPEMPPEFMAILTPPHGSCRQAAAANTQTTAGFQAM